MDEQRFDSLTRMVGNVANRRSTVRGLAGLSLGALLGMALRDEAGAADDADASGRKGKKGKKGKGKGKGKSCGKNKKKCGNKCISKNQCCKNNDCKGNQVCQNNKCTCKDGQKRCGNTCIANDQCCTDNDCTGANAGTCEDNTCDPAFTICTNANGDVSFVTNPPANPPVSNGAAKFKVGPDPAVNDWAHLRFAGYEGLEISVINKLEYSVYMEKLEDDSCPDFLPYMAIYTSHEDSDFILVQSDGPTGACEQWREVDAASDSTKWWIPVGTQEGKDFAPQGSPKTLAEIADKFDGMTIRNASSDTQCANALGGLRLEAGEWPGGGGTGDAEMYVSYLEVEIGDKKATYRF